MNAQNFSRYRLPLIHYASFMLFAIIFIVILLAENARASSTIIQDEFDSSMGADCGYVYEFDLRLPPLNPNHNKIMVGHIKYRWIRLSSFPGDKEGKPMNTLSVFCTSDRDAIQQATVMNRFYFLDPPSLYILDDQIKVDMIDYVECNDGRNNSVLGSDVQSDYHSTTGTVMVKPTCRPCNHSKAVGAGIMSDQAAINGTDMRTGRVANLLVTSNVSLSPKVERDLQILCPPNYCYVRPLEPLSFACG